MSPLESSLLEIKKFTQEKENPLKLTQKDLSHPYKQSPTQDRCLPLILHLRKDLSQQRLQSISLWVTEKIR